MSDRFYLNSLFRQGANNTTGYSSLPLGPPSINLNHSEKSNHQNSLAVNLSLDSYNSLPRNQAVPVLGQMGLNQYVAQDRISGRDIHSHRTTNSHPIPQKIVNLNILTGNNSFTNINLLNNCRPLQITINNQFPSSSIDKQIRNNVVSDASSNLKYLLPSLIPNQEHKWAKIQNSNKSSQIKSPYSPYASPSGSTTKGKGPSTHVHNHTQKIPTVIPYSGQKAFGSSHHQGAHCLLKSTEFQHSVPPGNSDMTLFSRLSSYLPTGKRYHLPTLLDSRMNLSNNKQDDPESTTGKIIEYQPQANSQAPRPEAIATGPQQTLAQNKNTNPIIDLNTHAKGRQNSIVRLRSHPYIKYGPYICPSCSAIFDNRHRFAAHIQNHYRKEFPAERKIRRESKIRDKELCIKKSIEGITVVPESLQLGHRLLVRSDTNDEEGIGTKKNEGFAPLKIKEEPRGSN